MGWPVHGGINRASSHFGLWRVWCNTLIPLKDIAKAFLARALCLILIPVVVYISTFWVHFRLLNEFSPTAASFTLQFQQNFAEGRIPRQNGPVLLWIDNFAETRSQDNPGYLHSHDALYPSEVNNNK